MFFRKTFIFICLIVVGLNANSVKAKVINQVSAGTLISEDESTYKIPVIISNNTGIMGFKICFRIDSDKVMISNIACGEAFTNGMFNYSLTKDQNQADILWSGTENVNDDGNMFYVYVKQKESFTDEIVIHLSYSQEDTFNDNYEDVQLVCSDIDVNTSETSESNNNLKSEVKNDNNIKEIEDSIYENVTKDAWFQFLVEIADKYNITVDSIVADELSSNTDNENIESPTNIPSSQSPSLKKIIQNCNKNDTQKIVDDIITYLSDNDVNVEAISAKNDMNNTLDILESIYCDNEEVAVNNNVDYIVALSVLSALIALLIVIYIIKRFRNNLKSN